jgi:hypothetical protein
MEPVPLFVFEVTLLEPGLGGLDLFFMKTVTRKWPEAEWFNRESFTAYQLSRKTRLLRRNIQGTVHQ